MKLTNLQRYWKRAAEERSLSVQTPFVLKLPDGSQVTAEVLLEGYGAPRGMLIVSDYTTISERKDAILGAGFGYSCYSQPPESEVESLEALDEVLEDWGANVSDDPKA